METATSLSGSVRRIGIQRAGFGEGVARGTVTRTIGPEAQTSTLDEEEWVHDLTTASSIVPDHESSGTPDQLRFIGIIGRDPLIVLRLMEWGEVIVIVEALAMLETVAPLLIRTATIAAGLIEKGWSVSVSASVNGRGKIS